MTRKYAEIFYWKNVSSFCSTKATHIFSAKNIRIFYIESAKTVNEMTLNKLIKLTTFWTTGPWLIFAGHSGSVWFASNWWSGGPRFDHCWVQQHSFMEIDHKYFLWSFSPFLWFKKGSCQFLVKECVQVLVNCLETKLAQEKSVVR